MSNSQIQVLFDRKDRTYRFNEEVSGKVVVDTQAKMISRRIWIEYGWRTHGKGDQDKGGTGRLTLLSQEVQLQAGEHREYTFQFKAPNGPVTYHGHILNVDWYVTAHLETPSRISIKKEIDFVLIVSEAPEEIILGYLGKSKNELPVRSRFVAKTIPGHSGTRPRNRAKDLTGTVLSVLVGLLFFVLFSLDSLKFYGVGLFGLLFCLGVVSTIYAHGFPVILNAIWKRMFETSDLRVTPSEFYPGDWVTCQLQFNLKRPVYLKYITATITAEEVAEEGGGSGTTTHNHIAYTQSSIKSYNEKYLAGRLASFDCILPVLPGAPATFKSSNNEIKWSVKVRISFKRWPSWEKSMPILVLP